MLYNILEVLTSIRFLMGQRCVPLGPAREAVKSLEPQIQQTASEDWTPSLMQAGRRGGSQHATPMKPSSEFARVYHLRRPEKQETLMCGERLACELYDL